MPWVVKGHFRYAYEIRKHERAGAVTDSIRYRLVGHTPFTDYSYYLINPTNSADGDIYPRTAEWSGLGYCESTSCAFNDTNVENSRLCLSGDYNAAY